MRPWGGRAAGHDESIGPGDVALDAALQLLARLQSRGYDARQILASILNHATASPALAFNAALALILITDDIRPKADERDLVRSATALPQIGKEAFILLAGAADGNTTRLARALGRDTATVLDKARRLGVRLDEIRARRAVERARSGGELR